MNRSRNYGIDLFRIISMLMVVALHVMGIGGILTATAELSKNYECAWFIETACFGAVNCFALVSGYVGLRSKHRYSNIGILWLQVVSLTVFLQIIQMCVAPQAINLKTFISAFMPILTRKYWYFTDYFVVFLFMPFLNAAVLNLERKCLRNSLIIISVVFSLSSFFPGPTFGGNALLLHDGYSALWLMLMYLIGAYVSMYNPFDNIKKYKLLLVYVGCVFTTFISKILLEHMPPIVSSYMPPNVFINYISPFVLIGSVALLLYFKRIPELPKYVTAVVKFVSPMCFGVYIIHLHPLVWSWMENRFAYISVYSMPFFVLMFLILTLGIFVSCMLLETIRFYIFNWLKIKERLLKLENKLINKEEKKEIPV